MVTINGNSVAPMRGENFPTGQREHVVSLNSEYLPATQSLHTVVAAALSWYVPATHSLHDLCFALSWYWPVVQDLQAEATTNIPDG